MDKRKRNKLYEQEYYFLNRERILARQKEYNKENKETIEEYQKEYYENNPEYFKKKNKLTYEKNKPSEPGRRGRPRTRPPPPIRVPKEKKILKIESKTPEPEIETSDPELKTPRYSENKYYSKRQLREYQHSLEQPPPFTGFTVTKKGYYALEW
jgi:hypothetical protein